MTLSYHQRSAEVYYAYAKAFNLCDKPEKAVKYLDKAIYFDPLYVDAYELKGDYSYSIGKNAEMKETFEKSRKRKKSIWQNWFPKHSKTQKRRTRSKWSWLFLKRKCLSISIPNKSACR